MYLKWSILHLKWQIMYQISFRLYRTEEYGATFTPPKVRFSIGLFTFFRQFSDFYGSFMVVLWYWLGRFWEGWRVRPDLHRLRMAAWCSEVFTERDGTQNVKTTLGNMSRLGAHNLYLILGLKVLYLFPGVGTLSGTSFSRRRGAVGL